MGLESDWPLVCVQGHEGKAGSVYTAEDLSLPGNKYRLSPTCRYPEPPTRPATSSNWVTTVVSSHHSLFPKSIARRPGELDQPHSVYGHTQHMAAASGDRTPCLLFPGRVLKPQTASPLPGRMRCGCGISTPPILPWLLCHLTSPVSGSGDLWKGL